MFGKKDLIDQRVECGNKSKAITFRMRIVTIEEVRQDLVKFNVPIRGLYNSDNCLVFSCHIKEYRRVSAANNLKSILAGQTVQDIPHFAFHLRVHIEFRFLHGKNDRSCKVS